MGGSELTGVVGGSEDITTVGLFLSLPAPHTLFCLLSYIMEYRGGMAAQKIRIRQLVMIRVKIQGEKALYMPVYMLSSQRERAGEKELTDPTETGSIWENLCSCHISK